MVQEKSQALQRAQVALKARLQEVGINSMFDSSRITDPNLLAIWQAVDALGIDERPVEPTAHAQRFLERYGGRLASLLLKANLPVNQVTLNNYVDPGAGF